MKKAVALAVLFVAVVAFSAQSKKPQATGTSGKAGGDASMLLEIENSWADAAMKKDVATLEKMYADDMTDVSPDGTVTNKQQDIEDLRNGTFVVESLSNDEMQPRVYGNTGVVTGISNIKGKYKGEDISGRYRFTDTYVKQNGQWKLVATQVTKIAEKQ